MIYNKVKKVKRLKSKIKMHFVWIYILKHIKRMIFLDVEYRRLVKNTVTDANKWF